MNTQGTRSIIPIREGYIPETASGNNLNVSTVCQQSDIRTTNVMRTRLATNDPVRNEVFPNSLNPPSHISPRTNPTVSIMQPILREAGRLVCVVKEITTLRAADHAVEISESPPHIEVLRKPPRQVPFAEAQVLVDRLLFTNCGSGGDPEVIVWALENGASLDTGFDEKLIATYKIEQKKPWYLMFRRFERSLAILEKEDDIKFGYDSSSQRKYYRLRNISAQEVEAVVRAFHKRGMPANHSSEIKQWMEWSGEKLDSLHGLVTGSCLLL